MPVSQKKLRSNRSWIERHINDPFVKMSRARGYRARSAFKLIEIDGREKVFHPGMTVVDLGSAPGSWSQVVRERLSRADGTLDGRIVAIDLLEMEPIDGVVFLQGDFREEGPAERLAGLLDGGRADAVISDMAPNLSGIPAVDAWASLHLDELALDFAVRYLKPEGVFIAKAFQGSGYSQFIEACRKAFRVVRQEKPAASRGSSPEMYVFARGLRQKQAGRPALSQAS